MADCKINPHLEAEMSDAVTYGQIYLPTRVYIPNASQLSRHVYTFFRDEASFSGDAVSLNFYADCGTTSPIIDQIGIPELQEGIKIIGEVGAVVLTLKQIGEAGMSALKKLTLFRKNRKELRKNLWPKALQHPSEELRPYLFSNIIALRSEDNFNINEEIALDRESSKVSIYRVAYSEDLISLYEYMDKIKYDCELQLNLAAPVALRLACERELGIISDLEQSNHLFSILESKYDIQARSKYMADPLANFARALCDSMCALRAAENYTQFNASPREVSRFSIRLYTEEPSFRGTITDNCLTYVDTEAWQPGMMGNLHVNRLTDDTRHVWKKIRKTFDKEIKQMNPEATDPYTARQEMQKEALDAIYAAKPRRGASANDLDNLSNLIRAIEYQKPSAKADTLETFHKIQQLRGQIRTAFGGVFMPLDEDLLVSK